MSEKLWHLKRCNLFEHLTPEELSRVESRSRARKFSRRSPIYLPADEGQSVFLLTSGRAKLCSFTPDGKQAILGFIEPGELFGELSIFDPGSREEYAEAVENSTVIMIPGEEIQRLMEAHPQVTLGITKLMGFRRRRIERRLKYLLFRSNRERLVHLLLELAEQYGSRIPSAADSASAVKLDIKLSHQDLANIIGSTRESVTVVLGELQAERLVRLARRQVVVLDLERLAASAETRAPEIPPSSGNTRGALERQP